VYFLVDKIFQKFTDVKCETFHIYTDTLYRLAVFDCEGRQRPWAS